MKAQLAFVLLLSCVLGVRSVWDDLMKEAKEDWTAAEEKMKLGWSNTEEEVKKEWKALAEAFVGKKEVAEESSESKESEEQDGEDVWKPFTVTDSGEDGEVDVMNRCSDICLKQSSQVEDDNYEATQDVCGQGCQAQARAFQGMEAQYPNTSPELLLGSAVDKCWEDCSARFSHGSILCIAGCDTMRKMQKKELLNRKDIADKKLKQIENKEAEHKEVEYKEIEHKELPKKKMISEKIEKIQHKADELKEAANEAHGDITKDGEDEGASRVWTYVLWRPAMNFQNLNLGSQEDAYQSYTQLVRMVQNMMGEMDIPRDPVQGRGWRDDRMQLSLPESADNRPAALSSDGGFYSRLTESLGGVKDRVEATMAAPGFRQDLYYILIGLSGFLLITTAFNSIFSKKSEDRQDEDHYFLHGKAAGAKLPTYEDCIKADRDLLVDINNQDANTKGPLPVFVVLEPVAQVHNETKQREEEETRENVA